MNLSFLSAIVIYLFMDHESDATLIASSKIRLCSRKNTEIEPTSLDHKKCAKKFVVALAVENGKVGNFLNGSQLNTCFYRMLQVPFMHA